MSLIVSEVYDALIEAGASETKAKAAAGAIPLAEQLATKEDLAVTRADLKDDIAAVRTEIAEVRTALKDDIAAVRTDLKDDIAAVRTEIAEVRADLSGLEARFYRQLWIMAAGIVGLTVTLTKLLA